MGECKDNTKQDLESFPWPLYLPEGIADLVPDGPNKLKTDSRKHGKPPLTVFDAEALRKRILLVQAMAGLSTSDDWMPEDEAHVHPAYIWNAHTRRQLYDITKPMFHKLVRYRSMYEHNMCFAVEVRPEASKATLERKYPLTAAIVYKEHLQYSVPWFMKHNPQVMALVERFTHDLAELCVPWVATFGEQVGWNERTPLEYELGVKIPREWPDIGEEPRRAASPAPPPRGDPPPPGPRHAPRQDSPPLGPRPAPPQASPPPGARHAPPQASPPPGARHAPPYASPPPGPRPCHASPPSAPVDESPPPSPSPNFPPNARSPGMGPRTPGMGPRAPGMGTPHDGVPSPFGTGPGHPYTFPASSAHRPAPPYPGMSPYPPYPYPGHYQGPMPAYPYPGPGPGYGYDMNYYDPRFFTDYPASPSHGRATDSSMPSTAQYSHHGYSENVDTRKNVDARDL